MFVFHTSPFEEGVRRGQAVVPDSGRCDCFYQDFVDNAQQLTFLYSLILPLVVFDLAFEVVGNQCPAGTRTRPDTRYFICYPTRPDSVLKIIG